MVDIPFFFTQHISQAIPTTILPNKINDPNKVHRINLNFWTYDNILDLLRIRRMQKNGEWEEISNRRRKKAFIQQYLVINGIKADNYLEHDRWFLKKPEIYLRYIQVDENAFKLKAEEYQEEVRRFQKENPRSDKVPQNLFRKKIYYRRLVHTSDNNNLHYYPLNSSVSLYNSSHKNCLGMIWFAENMKANSVNNLGNYTSNSTDHNQGYNPISSSTIYYVNDDFNQKNQEVPKRVFVSGDECLFSQYFFRNACGGRVPRQRNYFHGQIFAENLTNRNWSPDFSIPINNLSLEVYLAKSYIEEDEKTLSTELSVQEIINMKDEEISAREREKEKTPYNNKFSVHCVYILYDSFDVVVQENGNSYIYIQTTD
jgi:hypothetical protein